MRKKSLAAAIGLCALITPTALAADHQDGPATTADPAADITDVFAWMSDTTHLALVMDVTPQASTASQFSNAVKYVFHLYAYPSFPIGGAGAGSPSSAIVCTFDTGTPQNVSCWLEVGSVTTDYVHGNASAVAGLASQNGLMTVFTGLRDDPFFFNLDGFKATVTAVETAIPTLDAGIFTAAGCPQLDSMTAGALASQLGHAPDGGVAQDHFLGLNVLTIAINVNVAAVTSNGNPVLGVYASTHQ
jgi:hypothetical protein